MHCLANGGDLTVCFPLETMQQLDAFSCLPHWSHANPVDVLADSDAERFAKAVEIVSRDPESRRAAGCHRTTGLGRSDTSGSSRSPSTLIATTKPILASWMGGDGVAEGTVTLNTAGIPTFSYPDTAARAFTYMWRYTYNLRGLYETPSVVEEIEPSETSRREVSGHLQRARNSGRTLLNEFDSKQILAAYGIPIVPTCTATTEDDAAARAAEIGFPVAVKVVSTPSHIRRTSMESG